MMPIIVCQFSIKYSCSIEYNKGFYYKRYMKYGLFVTLVANI